MEIIETKLESTKFWYNKLSNRISTSSILGESRATDTIDSIKKFKHKLSREQEIEFDRVTGKSEFLRFVFLMTAVKLTLYIMNNKSHIVVGTPPQKSMEREKSTKENIVPIINEINLELSGKDLLMNVRKSLIDSYKHQDYPNDFLAKDLNLKENKIHQIVEVMMAHSDLHEDISNVNKMSILIKNLNNQVSGEIKYNSKQISEEQIDNFLNSIFIVFKELILNLKLSVNDLILKNITLLEKCRDSIEIEEELIKHPAVLDALVKRVSSDDSFVAYLIGKPNMLRSNMLIEHFLKKNLDNFSSKLEFVWVKDQEEMKEKFKQNSLSTNNVNISMPKNDLEKAILQIWVEILKVEDIGVNSNFFEIGGDSILSIEVFSQMKKMGLYITPKDILAYPTIKELSQKVKKKSNNLTEEIGKSTKVGITPSQHWFFSQEFNNPNHYNSARIYTFNNPINYPKIKQTYKLLAKHHDALRVRFTNNGEKWSQTISEEYTSCTYIDLSNLNDKEQMEAIEQSANKHQSNINITSGPLFSLVVFYLGHNKPGRLLIISHKLITDGLSMRILEDDFQSIYRSLLNNEEPKLPEKTSSYQRWSETLEQYTHSSYIEDELSYWTSKQFYNNNRFPVDFNEMNNNEKSTETIYASLSEDETKKMINLAQTNYQSKISAILFSSLLFTMYQWNGTKSIVFESGSHGREYIKENIDLSRTVGAFYNSFPVFLEMKEDIGIDFVTESVIDQLSNIPSNGIGFGLLKYLHKDGNIRSKVSSIPTPSIAFDFQGVFNFLNTTEKQNILGLANEKCGLLSDPENSRVYEFDISSWIAENQYVVRWKYSNSRFKRSTIDSLMNLYFENIRKLINQDI